MTTPPPPGRADWPALAAAAAQILAKRERDYPEGVRLKKITASEAEHGIKAARALALQWQAIMAHEDAPLDGLAYFEAFGCYPIVVRLEIADIAAAAARRAQADPTNEAKLLLAGACAALAWYQGTHGEPGDAPFILRIHAANQQARADRAARPAPAPTPLPIRQPRREPERQPQQQRAML